MVLLKDITEFTKTSKNDLIELVVSLRKKLSEKTADHSSDLNYHKAQMEIKESEIKRVDYQAALLKEDRDKLLERIKEMTEFIRTRGGVDTKQRTKIKELEALCDTHVETIVSFKDENQKLRKRESDLIDNYVETVSSLQNSIQSWLQTDRAKNLRIIELKSQIETNREVDRGLRKQIEYLKEKTQKLERSINTKLKEFDSLLAELTAKSKRGYLQISIKDVYARIAQDVERILNEGKEDEIPDCKNCYMEFLCLQGSLLKMDGFAQ